MRKIWELIRYDARRVFTNVISLVVCVGMIVVPCFYAWFNIAGSWDPYGNTKNLKVAVANSDDGYASELIPVSLNMGERMTSELRESTSIGYTVTSEEDAVEGVRSGKYYAAVVFPENFTRDLLSGFADSASAPRVSFYQNDKESAIGKIVTGKASTAIQQDIDESFAHALTTVGGGVLDELVDYLDDEHMTELAGKLDGAIDEAQRGLQDTASSVRGFEDILASTQTLLGNGADASTGSLSATLAAGNGLRQSAGDVRGLGTSVDGTVDAVNSALSDGAAGLSGVSDQIDHAFELAGTQTDKMADGLRQAAYTDALTGGSNFSGFLMKVNNAEGGYMVSCDLDDYRMIASMFGAQKGDELLRGVYECIRGGLTEGEPVARVDADHFAFHLVERQRSAVLERLRQIERRIRRLSDKMGVIHLVPRFGIYAMRPEEDARRSCELANLALGAARSSADNTVAFYQDLDQNAFFENMQLEDRFDEAIGEHQFKAYYQPKCNPKTGEIVGGEALVRWVQEDGTMLSPDRFIPLFEKDGAIGKLDEYMFTCVCAQLSQWRREGLEIRPVSVNLSRASLCRQGVALAYKRILEGYGLSTWMVPLEVTESAMISDDAVISVLQEFYRYGFRIEIDDFGKAQSTLPMLKLPFVDTVKLDKSLIDCIGDRKGEIMLRQVVRLCYELGLYTTAEGVEAEDQVDFLRALDCTDIQGYFFSPPLPVEKYTEKLRRQARKRA